MDKSILHVDMNGFYASVELLHRPALRDKPVVVGGDVEARHGIVLAKNELAKKCKIKTGAVIWQAKLACPDLVVLPPNYRLYLRFARLAREIYADYTDRIEPFGLDEAWLDVTGSSRLYGDAVSIAAEISERIKFELGITASIGVSWNKIYAKLGSDYKKPDAITVITRENYTNIVYPLPVGDLLYVGAATANKLCARGIKTIGDLAQADMNYISSFLHKPGEMVWGFANGYDLSPVCFYGEGDPIKSIGNSTTCPRDLICSNDVKLIMYVLAESVGARMRESGFEAGTLQLCVRDNQLAWLERQVKLPQPTNLARELVDAGMDLFERSYSWQRPIRSMGLRGTDLLPADGARQLFLTTDENKRDRIRERDAAVDRLRDRFGYFAVQRAFMMSDGGLTGLDAKTQNTIHPVSYRFS